MHGTDAYVLQALRAGAAGYLLKDAAVAELPLALRAVLRGEIYISSAVSRVVVSGFSPGPTRGSQWSWQRRFQLDRCAAQRTRCSSASMSRRSSGPS